MTRTTSSHVDPGALARHQWRHDAKLDQTAPGLAAHKRARVAVSAFSFLRGSAPLFYELLRRTPRLDVGGPGEAWLTGDLHIQNFGAFRIDTADGTEVTFGPNDFDEALIGPVRLDVSRFVTSWLLAFVDRSTEARVVSARAIVEGWAEGAGGGRSRPAVPAAVSSLVTAVSARTKTDLLASYVEGDRRRRFREGRQAAPITRSTAEHVSAAFESTVFSTSARLPEDRAPLEIVDVARRIAGTGSLGVERYVVLTRGGSGGEWLFDMKEQERTSSAGALVGARGPFGAMRVMRALEATTLQPRMLGVTRCTLRGRARSMLVRRLSPQEDKVDPTTVADGELTDVARYLGWLLGRVHRSTAVGSLRWSRRDAARVVEAGFELAGIHVAAHLAYVAIAAP